MSRLPLLVCAGLLVALPVGEVSAQRPFERLQKNWDDIRPRGKLLREIFGDGEDDKKERKKNRNKSDKRQPTPASKASHKVTPKTPARKHPNQLGIQVREADDHSGLVVDKISTKGAGYAAGIRRGDKITAVGGIQLQTKEDLDSLAEALTDGDQIEFDVLRRDKKKQMLVQFGNPATVNSTARPLQNSGDFLPAYSQQPNKPSRNTRQISSKRDSGQSDQNRGSRLRGQRNNQSADEVRSVLDNLRASSPVPKTRNDTPAWQVAPPRHSDPQSTRQRIQKQARELSTARPPSEIQELQQIVRKQQEQIQQLQRQLRRVLQNSEKRTAPPENGPRLGGPG